MTSGVLGSRGGNDQGDRRHRKEEGIAHVKAPKDKKHGGMENVWLAENAKPTINGRRSGVARAILTGNSR